MAYAQGTKVDRSASISEIERTLSRYGANAFMYGHDESGRAMVRFSAQGKRVRFVLVMPRIDEGRFHKTETGRTRKNPQAARDALEQEKRRVWRALALVIKAKLEAVTSGIVTFDEEFLAHIELPDGSTVGEHTLPKLEAAIRSQRPSLLALPSGGKQ